MTTQLDTVGPSTEYWRSDTFEATVDATPIYVYASTKTCNLPSAGWAQGASVEQSWITYGADTSTTVVVTYANATPITSAKIIPDDLGVTQSIAGGALTLTVPPDVRCRVEINGDRGEGSISLFSNPLKPTVPATVTDYTDWQQTVVAVEGTGAITVTAHGFTERTRLFMQTTGTLPKTTVGTLAPYIAFYADVIDANTLQLLVGTTETLMQFGDDGTGTHTICPADWTDTSTTLYFGAGEHQTGLGMTLANGCNVYVDVGAVVDGTWDFGNCRLLTGGAHIRGPGLLVCEAATSQEVQLLALADRSPYIPFHGIGNYNVGNDSTVSGVVCAAFPFYLSLSVVRFFDRVKGIAPWWYSTDGPRTSVPVTAGLPCGATDCYMLLGDDVYHFNGTGKTFTRCFGGTTSNSCFHGGYYPEAVIESTNLIQSCSAMHYGLATGSLGADSIVKSLVDGFTSQSALMHSGITIRGLKVYGPVIIVPIVLGNVAYPFGAGRDRCGQLYNWFIEDLWFEETPTLQAQIVGLNSANTPHDITFSRLQIGGVDVFTDNADTFFDVSTLAYDIIFDTRPEVVVELTDAEALWSYVVTIYDNDGLLSLTNIRNNAAIEVNDATGLAAATSVINLWPAYSQVEFDVANGIHLEVAAMGVIAVLWRRGGASSEIEQVKWDTVFGDNGLIEKVRRTSARGRTGPRSNSRTITSTTTTRYYGWSDPASLPPGYLPSDRSGY